MHVRDIDLNLFVVFDAIYTEGGVSRACFRLNLTQPAVSHALSRLRAMFNDPLFVRRHHVMTPTPLARQIITTVRQALNGLETTLTHTNRFDPAKTPKRFVIGLRNNLEAPMLSALVNRDQRAWRRWSRSPRCAASATIWSGNSPPARWMSRSTRCCRSRPRCGASRS